MLNVRSTTSHNRDQTDSHTSRSHVLNSTEKDKAILAVLKCTV